MNIGIVGLGLIGGSLAKAYKADGHKIWGIDTDKSILNF
ncbi:MAG: prephenate dehydrogenase/arogenate dehydrogenase family protein, partial [Oscillospiraceae bacterium]|nr:prephenate dehydrogenase/arogenate dehydrogenase family protein [Oscillospiraceae bacterium]